jgi:integrase/recombinase XerC
MVTFSKNAGSLPFQAELLDWLEAMRREGKSDRTIDCYRRDIRQSAQSFADHRGRVITLSEFSSLDQDEVDAIISEWQSQGTSVSTILRRFSAIRGFAHYLEVHKHIECRRLLWATLPSVTRASKHGLNQDIIISLTAPRDTDTWIELRGRAIVALQSSTGLTTSEIVALNLGDVSNQGRIVVVEKTHLARRIVMSSEYAASLLAQYINAAPFVMQRDAPLFSNARGDRLSTRSVQMTFRRLAAELGVPMRYGPMCLRHSAGRSLVENGRTPAEVATALGISVSVAAQYFSPEWESGHHRLVGSNWTHCIPGSKPPCPNQQRTRRKLTHSRT